MKYYSLNNILKHNANYNVIYGERSNGKTYSVLQHILRTYIETGKQGAIIRRWQDDFTGKRGATMFDALDSNREVEKWADLECEWTGIYYWSSRWYLCRYDENGKRIVDERPFCYGFSLSAGEHDKSTSYPDITTILFDEFLTRSSYLPDEFILFMNVLSTIIRHRNDVKIFMLGNTVNKYCPYFTEMGLNHVKDQEQGTIDIYRYGESTLTVAVEYCKPTSKGKSSDVYFAFENPKLQMVKTGAWELDIYPHLPEKYKPKDILFTYFIQFDKELLQCEIIQSSSGYPFTFIHRKSTELKNTDEDIIYSTEYDARPNWRRNLRKPITLLDKKILRFFVEDKIFYQDNEVGEIVRNYLVWCGKAVR